MFVEKSTAGIEGIDFMEGIPFMEGIAGIEGSFMAAKSPQKGAFRDAVSGRTSWLQS